MTKDCVSSECCLLSFLNSHNILLYKYILSEVYKCYSINRASVRRQKNAVTEFCITYRDCCIVMTLSSYSFVTMNTNGDSSVLGVIQNNYEELILTSYDLRNFDRLI